MNTICCVAPLDKTLNIVYNESNVAPLSIKKGSDGFFNPYETVLPLVVIINTIRKEKTNEAY